MKCNCVTGIDYKIVVVPMNWSNGGFGEPSEEVETNENWNLCQTCRNKAYHLMYNSFGESIESNKVVYSKF